MPRKRASKEARFWPKVDQQGPIPSLCPELGPCWLWKAAIGPYGYGYIGAGGHAGPMVHAHRVSYELHFRKLLPLETIDHLCNNRACVNPRHLDPCTTQENTQRAVDRRTSCKRGHVWPENLYYTASGIRRCRACNTEKAREYRKRKRTST